MDLHVTLIMMRHGGARLLKPMVKMMTTLPIVEAGKLPQLAHTPNGPVVRFWRHPRDRVVGMYRWWKDQGGAKFRSLKGRNDDERIVSLLRLVEQPRPGKTPKSPIDLAGLPMIQAMRLFVVHWRDIPAFELKYERLISPETGPREVGELGTYLGYSPPVDADSVSIFDACFRKTHGWTGQAPSRWQDWFGPASTRFWEENGGLDLENLMGY